MRSKGKLPVNQIRLKDGFYIEVYNKGLKYGMKIRNESKELMEDAAGRYARYKQVVILGEYKNGLPFSDKIVSVK